MQEHAPADTADETKKMRPQVGARAFAAEKGEKTDSGAQGQNDILGRLSPVTKELQAGKHADC